MSEKKKMLKALKKDGVFLFFSVDSMDSLGDTESLATVRDVYGHAKILFEAYSKCFGGKMGGPVIYCTAEVVSRDGQVLASHQVRDITTLSYLDTDLSMLREEFRYHNGFELERESDNKVVITAELQTGDVVNTAPAPDWVLTQVEFDGEMIGDTYHKFTYVRRKK